MSLIASSYDTARIRFRDHASQPLPLSGSLSNFGEHDPSERTCRCLRSRKAHVLPYPCRRRQQSIAFGQRTCPRSVQIDAIHVVCHQRPQLLLALTPSTVGTTEIELPQTVRLEWLLPPCSGSRSKICPRSIASLPWLDMTWCWIGLGAVFRRGPTALPGRPAWMRVVQVP